MEDLARAIELDPNVYSYHSRGIAHANMGENHLAMADFQRALMLAHDATTRAIIEQTISELNE